MSIQEKGLDVIAYSTVCDMPFFTFQLLPSVFFFAISIVFIPIQITL